MTTRLKIYKALAAAASCLAPSLASAQLPPHMVMSRELQESEQRLQQLSEELKLIKLSQTAAIDWVQKSVEYAAAASLIFRVAWEAVSRFATSQQSHWAVVLDIDDTIVSSAPFQRDNLGKAYDPVAYESWVRTGASAAVPGAKEFLDKVHALGPNVHVAFLTDRPVNMDSSTREELKRLGLYRDGDLLLSRRHKTDTKAVRRTLLELGLGHPYGFMPILAMLGDSIRDFYELEGAELARQERDLAPSDSRWGERFFMLPNPMYGPWQRDYK